MHVFGHFLGACLQLSCHTLCCHAVKKRVMALSRRELTLFMRNFVVYKAKVLQVGVMALIASTLFLRTHIHPINPDDGQEIGGFLYFSTLMMLFNGIAELTMTVSKLLQRVSFALNLIGFWID